MCGGSAYPLAGLLQGRGLSPRVRGIPYGGLDGGSGWRSIPACAGDPMGTASCRRLTTVYPRVCGGSRELAPMRAVALGLSPRVRGIPSAASQTASSVGSIPACAGDPSALGCEACPRWVYPRVCGGSRQLQQRAADIHGLSPRVRGIPRIAERAVLPRGSIPACAGDPTCGMVGRMFAAVYPRVCGGSRPAASWIGYPWGLSPRVRGIHHRGRERQVLQGSIPACAGDPTTLPASSSSRTVYPRVCGGSASSLPVTCVARGLSPRVRGILDKHARRSSWRRSIPACAGDPQMEVRRKVKEGVYPRVCGGSCQPRAQRTAGRGLSPRVRGILRWKSGAR